LIILDKWR